MKTNQMAEKKAALRSQVKSALAMLSINERLEKSNKIANLLYATPEWKNAKLIGITISTLTEVDTFAIIDHAWSQNKKIAIPKSHPKTKEMTFHLLENFDQLENIYVNLLEPIPTKTTLVDKENIDLLIVPGLAFTTTGKRLGMGGGFYDRFIKDFSGVTLALAFSQQLLDEVPTEAHDMTISKIITD